MQRQEYTEAIQKLAFSHHKMAFITGPRQVGKTTLAQQLAQAHAGASLYFNWDEPRFRRAWIRDSSALLQQEIGKRGIAILDEIHKAPRWKNTLKGIYDTRKEHWDLVVTGSARLDVFRRGGDSLLGRYFLFRLHPLTVGEILGENSAWANLPTTVQSTIPDRQDIVEALLEYSGFPEPYLKKDPAFLNLWRRTRIERLIREDLRDLTRAQDFSMIEALAALLPERVGSTLSVASLREDLETSHPTLKRWLNWLEQIFYLYQLKPYTKKLQRSLKKETKPYLWDWSEVENPSARFENLVAGHLLKACHYAIDTGLGTFELHYLRDKEKREVDFLVVRDKKPWLLAECKESDTDISPALKYYAAALKPKLACQIVKQAGVHERVSHKDGNTTLLISAGKILSLLP